MIVRYGCWFLCVLLLLLGVSMLGVIDVFGGVLLKDLMVFELGIDSVLLVIGVVMCFVVVCV